MGRWSCPLWCLLHYHISLNLFREVATSGHFTACMIIAVKYIVHRLSTSVSIYPVRAYPTHYRGFPLFLTWNLWPRGSLDENSVVASLHAFHICLVFRSVCFKLWKKTLRWLELLLVMLSSLLVHVNTVSSKKKNTSLPITLWMKYAPPRLTMHKKPPVGRVLHFHHEGKLCRSNKT